MCYSDGHGNSGHLASEFIVNSLPDKLLDLFLYEKPNADSHQNLTEGFLRLHNELIDNHEIDTRFSGTTCISTIISKEKIVCANLGDSRAVLGKCVKGQWRAVNLSRDHKASEIDESTRIIKRGGRIASYIDEETKESVGPQRVWLKEADIPGLAMTRSFGDQIAHCVGVTCEPEIKEYSFQGGEKFIVLGSDGIWEFIDSVECVHIIKEYYIKGDVRGACKALIDEAFNRWIKDQNVVDDITIIIAFLD